MSDFLIPLQRERSPGRPAVDLRMVGGRGYIRGRCGYEDDGRTFNEAADYLRRLATLEGEVHWDIHLELDLILSTSLRAADVFMAAMAEIAREHHGVVRVHWRVPASNMSLMSLAEDYQSRLGGGPLQIVVEPKA